MSLFSSSLVFGQCAEAREEHEAWLEVLHTLFTGAAQGESAFVQSSLHPSHCGFRSLQESCRVMLSDDTLTSHSGRFARYSQILSYCTFSPSPLS